MGKLRVVLIGSGRHSVEVRSRLAALAIASVEVVEGARPEDPRPYYRRYEKRSKK